MRLLLIHDSVKDIPFIIGCLTETTEYVLINTTDTVESVLSKVNETEYESVGIMRDHTTTNTYFLFDGLDAIIENVETEDPELTTWSWYKDLLFGLKNKCNMNTLDVIECHMYNTDMQYIFNKLSNALSILIPATDEYIGDGLWNLGDFSLIESYFIVDIKLYKYEIGTTTQFTYILRSDGYAYGYGSNNYGQLGLGRTGSQSTPPTAALTNVKSLYTGLNHVFFIKYDGTLWACGYNPYGNLGLGDTTDRFAPTQVTALTNVIMVASGAYHALFLLQNGDVYSVGANDLGQLGIGASGTNLTMQKVALSNAVQVACGYNQSYVLLQNGNVYAFGRGDSGQFGDGTANTYTYTPKLIQTGVSSVITMNWNALFLKTNGDLYGCGTNTYGELAGVSALTQVKTAVLMFSNVASAYGGGAQAGLIYTNGDAYIWGYNAFHQLGNGTTTTSAPFKVSYSGITNMNLSIDSTIMYAGDTVYAAGDGGGFSTSFSIPSSLPALIVIPIPVAYTCFTEDALIQTDQGLIKFGKLSKWYHTLQGRRIASVTITKCSENYK